MGDMKTPDFDDLLAAFDIPDIDAKEAIQSSPEQDGDEVGTNAAGRESGSPACSPCSPASDSERPVVSVIVKNTVRSEDEEKPLPDNTDCPSRSELAPRVQVNFSDLNSQLCHNRAADAAAEPQVANGFQGSVPRGRDPWSLRLPLRAALDEDEGLGGKGADVGSIRLANDVMSRLNPLLFPRSLTGAAHNSMTAPSLRSVRPQLSPHHPEKEEDDRHLGHSSAAATPQNRSFKEEIKHEMHSDDVDSEPDLGSPLVIHESPEYPTSSPPKLKPRVKPQLRSPENAWPDIRPPPQISSLAPAAHRASIKDEGHSASAASRPQSPEDRLPSVITGSASFKEEEYPEHVIDERDSPESPPPSETGLVVPSRSRSPDLPKAPGLVMHADFQLKDEHTRDEPGREEPSEKKAGRVEKIKDENSCAGSSSEDTASAGAAETDSSPLRPLKVKIKVSRGAVKKAATGKAPKRSARATSGAPGVSKPSPQRRSVKSKREPSPSSAGADAAGASKKKSTVDTKPKVSPTAVSITKSAALPSVAAPRVSPAGINLRSLGQRTLNSGMILPAPASLLPLQSGGKPASIVNNSGAIISKSQTNLVEAFNKILNNKNLLPCYKPDLSSPLPAEWGIALPAQGYRCLECGDAFALEQSLARHYDRCSLRIEVTCNHCAKRLAFFNKCSLLLHAREHKERGLIMQCSHLVMKTVPVEQMIGQQEPAAIAPSQSSLGSASPNPAPHSLKAVTSKKAEETQHVDNKCPECLTQFSSKEEVAEHFQEIKAALTMPCTDCSPPMLLPNVCSAAAHQRIHRGGPPHVCPECGGTAKQPQFQAHLDETCLHFSRRIGYRCSSCLVVFGGLNSVKSHIQQAHCDMFHKCPNCPMAFKSAPSIQNHIAAQHPTAGEGQAILIYKCVMCDTVFTQKPLLYLHFDTHLANQKVHVFKCPHCTKLFSQRRSLLDHSKTHTTPTLKQELPSPPAASSCSRPSVKLESSDGEEEMNEGKEKKIKKERIKTPSGWKCAPCHARYTDREDYITHMADQHCKTLKKFPCNKCESSFTTTSSMRRHIRDKHKVMNRAFRCRFCTEGKKTFSSRALLERHVLLRHNIDTVSSDALMGDEADSSSEQDGRAAALRRRRGAVKMEQKEESIDGAAPAKKSRPSSAPSPLAPPDSGFRCTPCGFTTEEQASFLEHIGQHRRAGTEGGGLQCLQCGACFTSNSSLSRHRFITHKVKHATAGHRQAPSAHPPRSPADGRDHEDKTALDCSAPPSPSPHGNEEQGTLACRVCGKHFEKASDLNTHFRTHGMAFINARNAGKST